jgi:putative aminopeptidase FrvX
MDTCQSEDDREIGEHLRYDEDRGIFLAESPDGDRYQMGADDKAGISTILALAGGTDLPFKILATVREEEGQQGIQEVPPDFYADCAFGLTLDRRGRGDIIPTYHGRTCAPDHIVTNLISLGEEEGMGYWKTCGGSIADTYYIAEHIPALNISTGYYNPHTCLDYIRVDETCGALRLARACIEHPERLLRRSAPSD